MRLWIVSSSYPAHPAESINAGVLARDIAIWARDRGDEVTVVTPQKPEGLRVDDGLAALPLPWLLPTKAMSDLSPRRPLDLLRMVSLMAFAPPRLLAAARRFRPDGVVAFWGLPSGIFARRVRRSHGVPYSVWLLGSDVWHAARYPGGVRLLRGVLASAAARFADGTELASRAEKLTGFPVDFLPSIRRLPPPAGIAEPCDVLYVGRYHVNKGPDVLLQAFARVVDRRPGTTLRMHGIGELRPQLEQRARQPDLARQVCIAGPLDAVQLASALRAARVLVIPSRIESIPLILGDGAQAGVVVIGTDVGDVGRVIRAEGLGSVVPPEDPNALADALLAELDGRRARRAAAHSHFSFEATARRLLAALEAAPGEVA